jgi:hypothetical protein
LPEVSLELDQVILFFATVTLNKLQDITNIDLLDSFLD